MRRREVLATLGTTVVGGVAGCSGVEESVPDNVAGESTSQTATQASTEDAKACEPDDTCFHSWVKVRQINEITDSKLRVQATVQAALRGFILNVYQNTPSKDDPGTWELEPVWMTPRWDEEEKEWKYGKTNRNPRKARPVITYDQQGKKVASVRVKNGREHGYTFADKDENPDNRYGGIHVEMEFDIPKPPTYTPFNYSFERVAITQEGEPRYIDSYTQEIIRLPDGTYLYPPRESNGEQEEFPIEGFEDNRIILERHPDEFHRVRVLPVTSLTRYSLSESKYSEYYRRISGFPLSPGVGKLYYRGILQRPWYYQVKIPKDVAEKAQKQNYDEYIKPGGANARWPESPNIARIAKDPKHTDHDLVQKIASDLSDIADRLGFTSTPERVQIVQDFVSHLKYQLEQNKKGVPTVKTPVETLYNAGGDCEDTALLLYSLLKQDQFDVSPVIARIDGLPTTWLTDEEARLTSAEEKSEGASHVSVGVDLEPSGPGVLKKNDGSVEYTEFGGGYTYLECTAPAPLGWMSEEWPDPYVMDLDKY